MTDSFQYVSNTSAALSGPFARTLSRTEGQQLRLLETHPMRESAAQSSPTEPMAVVVLSKWKLEANIDADAQSLGWQRLSTAHVPVILDGVPDPDWILEPDELKF